MRFALPLLAGLAGVASMGAARPGIGYEAAPVDPVAVRIMAVYAQCVVARDPQQARTLLAADYRTDAYENAVRDFARSHRDCVPTGGKLRFNQIIFAGDMAETLMKRGHLTPEQLKEKAASDTAQTTARCVIQKRPDGVAALLASRPASPEERAVVASLQDALEACTRQGVTTISNSVGLRARLALATYRLLNSPAPTSAGS